MEADGKEPRRRVETNNMLAWMGGTRKRMKLGSRGSWKRVQEKHILVPQAESKHVGASGHAQKRKRMDHGMSKDVKRLKLKVHPTHADPKPKQTCSEDVSRVAQPGKTGTRRDAVGAAPHKEQNGCTENVRPCAESHAVEEPQESLKLKWAAGPVPDRSKQKTTSNLNELIKCQQAAEGLKQDLAKGIIGEIRSRVCRAHPRTEGYATLLPRHHCK